MYICIVDGYARFKGIVAEEPASKRFRPESIFDRKAQIDPEKLLRNAATASSAVITTSRSILELADFNGARAVEQRRQLSTPYPERGRTVMVEDLQDLRDAQTDPFYAHVLSEIAKAEQRAESTHAANPRPEARLQAYKAFINSSAVFSASSGTSNNNATDNTLKPYKQLPHPGQSSITHHAPHPGLPTTAAASAPKRRCQFSPGADRDVVEFWLNDAPSELNDGGNRSSVMR